jgi:hypothetical protein
LRNAVVSASSPAAEHVGAAAAVAPDLCLPHWLRAVRVAGLAGFAEDARLVLKTWDPLIAELLVMLDIHTISSCFSTNACRALRKASCNFAHALGERIRRMFQERDGCPISLLRRPK